MTDRSRDRALTRFSLPGALLAALFLAAGCGPAGESDGPTGNRGDVEPGAQPKYIGRQACAGCHAAEDELWRGSDHDLAMQEATEETVLGDFDGATYTHFGVTSTFSKRGGKFIVRTDGPDGKLADFEIAYAFGVRPLQQYLVAFPGGRLQALSLAWDSRPASPGGRRWFHLYPGEPIPFSDNLHWTRLNQNWNHMCAGCHSVNVKKGYDAATRSFDTTWSEIDVACEACHGPGSRHVEWARMGRPMPAGNSGPRFGLTVDIGGGGPAVWAFDPVTGIAKRSPALATRTELNACAPCHSRRSTLAEGVLPDEPLTSAYRPSLLEEDLYHADGQILGEVYEYGSFVQSRMHAAGVTCSDCHDPHSLRLRAEPDAVCARCHLPARFEGTEHHHHEAGSEGASCVACHMPARTYMVVDPRRDHGFRVPRPDLTAKLGTPNACNGCHVDRPAAWAAAAVEGWSRRDAKARPAIAPGGGGSNRYAEAIHAGREGLPFAERALAGLVEDTSQPGIARATALNLLSTRVTPSSLQALEPALRDADPLVRMAALEALEASGSPDALRLGAPLLEDSALAVRVQAGRSIAGFSRETMSPAQREALSRALADYRAAQELNADRPEAQLNLAWLHTVQGNADPAEKACLEAIFLDPDFIPAYVNLADLYRLMQRDEDGERVLREGLGRAPEAASLHHALGLNLVRRGKLEEAIASLRRAADLAPGEPRFAYVLGVALHEAGRATEAMAVLGKARERHPEDRSILEALVAFSRDAGKLDAALAHARTLALLAPGDPAVREVIRQLESLRKP